MSSVDISFNSSASIVVHCSVHWSLCLFTLRVAAVGVVAARDALLTFMVGGTKFDDAKKVLENMGKNVIHCGPVGMGQVRILVILRSVFTVSVTKNYCCE